MGGNKEYRYDTTRTASVLKQAAESVAEMLSARGKQLTPNEQTVCRMVVQASEEFARTFADEIAPEHPEDE